jgi:hypothetical protein
MPFVVPIISPATTDAEGVLSNSACLENLKGRLQVKEEAQVIDLQGAIDLTKGDGGIKYCATEKGTKGVGVI